MSPISSFTYFIFFSYSNPSKDDSMRGDGEGTAAFWVKDLGAEVRKPNAELSVGRGRARELERQGVVNWLTSSKQLQLWIVLLLVKRKHSNEARDVCTPYSLEKGSFQILKRCRTDTGNIWEEQRLSEVQQDTGIVLQSLKLQDKMDTGFG